MRYPEMIFGRRSITKLAKYADEFLLVTQNVDDLHVRAGMPAERMVQIHGDIFVTRCSRCEWRAELRDAGTNNIRDHTGLAGARPSTASNEHPPSSGYGAAGEHESVPRCPECGAMMRPGVVWFGEQLPWSEVQRVETYLDRGSCDVVIVAGTTATFGYIIDWALRGKRDGGQLVEVNPEETPLSRFATRLVREPAAIALPSIVDQFISQMKL